MTRVPEVSPAMPQESPALVDEVARWLERLGGYGLHLFRALGNAPLAYRGFSELSVRVFLAELSPRVREGVILRVTSLAGSDYEWSGHLGAARAAGLTDEEIRGLRSGDTGALPEEEAAAIEFAAAVEQGTVDEQVWSRARACYDDQRMVELAMLAGFYGLASRVARALDVDLEQGWRGIAYP
jgi:alkylhydroperoxidase family enzyme